MFRLNHFNIAKVYSTLLLILFTIYFIYESWVLLKFFKSGNNLFFTVVILFIVLQLFPGILNNFFTYHCHFFRCHLTPKQSSIVSDVQKTIKNVNSDIELCNFKIYKPIFSKEIGYTVYNKEKKISYIFINWIRMDDMYFSEDQIFEICLHEILHSQNLKKYNFIFKIHFLEGLNQFFTEWLIINYSNIYHLQREMYVEIPISKKLKFHGSVELNIYKKEVDIVKQIFNENEIDIKEAFLNYINFNPNYFTFIPSNYFIKK